MPTTDFNGCDMCPYNVYETEDTNCDIVDWVG